MTDKPRQVVLDTDIGTNVDDVLALLMLTGEPTVSLRAVTTVDGDVALRARHALNVLRLVGQERVPVRTGAALPASGRPIWPAPSDPMEEPVPPGAVDTLIDVVRAAPGEVTVVAIGPLTNVAAAIERDPGWVPALRQLIVMGGDFASGRAEHNVATDPDAARAVFESGAPAVHIGSDVTTTVPFDESDLDAAASTGGRLAALVSDYARAWWKHLGRPTSHPHDALAVLAMLEPRLFDFAVERWRVHPDGALHRDDTATAIRHATGIDAVNAREALRLRWAALNHDA